MNFVDQVKRPLQLPKVPKRIISLVPSHTELLCQLGMQDQLVGLTKFCVHPSTLKSQKTIVGGTKTIHLEKIKKLRPDLILCNKEENTKAIVKSCETIAPVYVSDIISLDSNIEFIQAMGILLEKEKNAQHIIEKISQKQKEFIRFIRSKKQQRVAYFIWRKPWMVAGGNTFIDTLLQLNNYHNVFGHKDRYPEIDPDDLASKDLDLILLSSEPYPFKKQHEKELQKYSSATIIQVDGEAFSWHGSYLIKALEYFKTLHKKKATP